MSFLTLKKNLWVSRIGGTVNSISVILRRLPYGTVDASEAVRHALGGITEDMAVKLILVDGGVAVAKKGQNTNSTEYLNMESGIIDCIDMGAEVYDGKFYSP
jgi:sulfur relay (sulfurtransferase) DsrF/TusC family protein